MVSSDKPTKSFYKLINKSGFFGISSLSNFNKQISSSDKSSVISGSYFDSLYILPHLTPSNIIKVMSPPSSTIEVGPNPSSNWRAYKVHHQYSSKFSSFQAKTLQVPFLAMAAAAWSWVENILQEHHLTLAPNASRVSMRTAV